MGYPITTSAKSHTSRRGTGWFRSSQRISYPLLVSRGFQIPISNTADYKSAVTEVTKNISILYLNISIIMYQNVPIELIERIEALERRLEKN